MMKRHVLNGSRVLLIVDPDVDGFTSASLFYLFMQDYAGNGMQIDYHIPEGKEHGLQTLMGLFEGPRKYDLVVVPDGGSNDYEEHKTLSERGYDVLILDHHQAPHYSDHAVLINNQLSNNYENKELSGVGVVWKFCEYFEYRYWEDMKPDEQFESKASYYIDLVALGLISDMEKMYNLENRYICTYGLTHINNGLFKELIEKQSFSLGTRPLTQIGIAFYITPLINALIRVGSQTEKTLLFEAFITPNKIVPSTKRGDKGNTETLATQVARYATNAKKRQDTEMDRAAELLDIQIMENCLDDNKILILNADELNTPNTLTGLCAMRVAAKHKKPVILGRTTPDGKYIKGSMRGRDGSELKNFQAFLNDSGLVEYCEGHPQAAGCGVRISNIGKLTDYANEQLANIDFNEGFYEADFIVNGNCSYLAALIEDMDRGRELWGQGCNEPVIIVENIPVNVSDFQVIGKNKDTLKFIFNGVTYIKFKAKNLIEDLSMFQGKLNLTVAGRCNMNEWAGRRSPQIMLDEIEIKESSMDDF